MQKVIYMNLDNWNTEVFPYKYEKSSLKSLMNSHETSFSLDPRFYHVPVHGRTREKGLHSPQWFWLPLGAAWWDWTWQWEKYPAPWACLGCWPGSHGSSKRGPQNLSSWCRRGESVRSKTTLFKCSIFLLKIHNQGIATSKLFYVHDKKLKSFVLS